MAHARPPHLLALALLPSRRPPHTHIILRFTFILVHVFTLSGPRCFLSICRQVLRFSGYHRLDLCLGPDRVLVMPCYDPSRFRLFLQITNLPTLDLSYHLLLYFPFAARNSLHRPPQKLLNESGSSSPVTVSRLAHPTPSPANPPTSS